MNDDTQERIADVMAAWPKLESEPMHVEWMARVFRELARDRVAVVDASHRSECQFVMVELREGVSGGLGVDPVSQVFGEIYRRQPKHGPHIAPHPESVEFKSVNSSNLDEVSWHHPGRECDARDTLYIRFHETPGTYVYANAPHETVAGLMNADSHGAFHNREIVDEFPYCRVPEDG